MRQRTGARGAAANDTPPQVWQHPTLRRSPLLCQRESDCTRSSQNTAGLNDMRVLLKPDVHITAQCNSIAHVSHTGVLHYQALWNVRHQTCINKDTSETKYEEQERAVITPGARKSWIQITLISPILCTIPALIGTSHWGTSVHIVSNKCQYVPLSRLWNESRHADV